MLEALLSVATICALLLGALNVMLNLSIRAAVWQMKDEIRTLIDDHVKVFHPQSTGGRRT